MAKYQYGYQVISEVDNNDDVDTFSAVMGRNNELINASDFLSYEGDGKVYRNLPLYKCNV